MKLFVYTAVFLFASPLIASNDGARRYDRYCATTYSNHVGQSCFANAANGVFANFRFYPVGFYYCECVDHDGGASRSNYFQVLRQVLGR
jgi:hypothetical protein